MTVQEEDSGFDIAAMLAGEEEPQDNLGELSAGDIVRATFYASTVDSEEYSGFYDVDSGDTLFDIIPDDQLDTVDGAFKDIREQLIGPGDPHRYIPEMQTKADSSLEERALAHSLLREYHDMDTASGVSPDSYAAAALYRAGELMGNSISQDDFSDRVGVTANTVRRQTRNLFENRKY